MLVICCSAEQQFDLVCTSGRPFQLLDVRLMGPGGALLHPGSGQVGEVQCRGPTVFAGYWQLPQASQDAFTSDGWFCTGDLATINAAGYITVVDRIKDMILHGAPILTTTQTLTMLLTMLITVLIMSMHHALMHHGVVRYLAWSVQFMLTLNKLLFGLMSHGVAIRQMTDAS